MNKVILTEKALEYLHRWGDEHTDFVAEARKVCPMKAIKFICGDKGDKEITYIREDNKLAVLFLENYGVKINYKLKYQYDENFELNLIDIKIPDKFKEAYARHGEEFANHFTRHARASVMLYEFVMALMVYNNEYSAPEEATDRTQKTINKNNKKKNVSKKKSKSKSDGIVYLIKGTSSDNIRVTRKGSHAKPNGQFDVRGHYRHYKNGKVIWIKEYVKGKGKEVKDKTYKINPNTRVS